jgi:uncharacterized protein YaiI (UPF0178 family)
MPRILVDADACPVKDEVYRVARRLAVPVVVVANCRMQVPFEPGIELVVVASGQLDDVDDWIAERSAPGDVVITADIRLAARGLEAGAQVIGPDGRPFDAEASARPSRRASSWPTCASSARSPADRSRSVAKTARAFCTPSTRPCVRRGSSADRVHRLTACLTSPLRDRPGPVASAPSAEA